MPTVTNEIIEAAIAGFEGQKQHIDAKIAELRAMLNGGSSMPKPHATAHPAAKQETAPAKRKFSASALKRMREAQQRRWAKVRRESAPAAKTAKTVTIKKTKRKMSAAGRKAIAEAQRKRWAAKKAEKA